MLAFLFALALGGDSLPVSFLDMHNIADQGTRASICYLPTYLQYRTMAHRCLLGSPSSRVHRQESIVEVLRRDYYLLRQVCASRVCPVGCQGGLSRAVTI